ncbi:MAG: peptide deformylase, partial [Clostridia bacterium]|nr:peptide deformylase [Clostridia bacterium]
AQTGQEGCLSIPKRYEEVTRPKKVTVEFFDRFGNKMTLTASDFMARAICHEYDHLDGVLYVDHVKKNNNN